jgi:hypothetical protein
MSVAKRLEIRTIIKFCANIGKTQTDTYKELKKASGDKIRVTTTGFF